MSSYGVREDNNIADAAYDSSALDSSDESWLGDPRLKRIDRLRLLTERGYPYMDVSYCYGTLKDGRRVRVQLTRQQFNRKGLKRQLVELAERANVYGKGLHLLDDDVISILWG